MDNRNAGGNGDIRKKGNGVPMRTDGYKNEKNEKSENRKMSKAGGYEVKQDISQRKQSLTKGTKYLLDFMFYAGILVTLSLPWSVKWAGKYLERINENYEATVIIYFVLGIAALVLIRELRHIFQTVLEGDCFVPQNVSSLQKMGNWSFFIALMSVVRSIVYLTVAMAVVILVFVIAGLFSKVLAMVFEEAVRYKEENDLTI